jgi:Uma2 family endonuclease
MVNQEAAGLVTADDLLQSTELRGRHELIEGRLVEVPPAGYEHGNRAAVMIYFLVDYARSTRRGRVQTSETGYRTRQDERTVRAPDASFMPFTKVPAEQKPQGYLDIPPDVVVEVISPYDSAEEVEQKTQEWLNFGVLMVVNVYPVSQRIHVFRTDASPVILTIDNTLDGGDVLPGFSVPIRQLFED